MNNPSDLLQHIQFEGADVCIIAPEDYDAECAKFERVVTERDQAREAAERFRQSMYAVEAECLAEIRELRAILEDTVVLADGAMLAANRDGGEYDRDAELLEARTKLGIL